MKVYSSLQSFKNVDNPVLTTGTFDGVHIGHQKIISHLNEVAKSKNGESVLLTFHPHPRLVLFPDDSKLRLINTQVEKIKRLEEAGLQHLIICPFTKEFSRMGYVEYVREVLVNGVGVKHLVIGYDHQFGRNREGSYEQLEELAPIYDFELAEIPAQTIDDVKVSSTKIRNAIISGDMDTVTNYLGYRFHLSGMVTEGNKLGRQLGYPTANIALDDPHKIVPGDGVYAVKMRHDNSWYDAMLNIGKKPTVNNNGQSTIEVHAFNFNQEIYGHAIEIEFVSRMRDEQKFASKDELVQQLHSDKLYAINLLDK